MPVGLKFDSRRIASVWIGVIAALSLGLTALLPLAASPARAADGPIAWDMSGPCPNYLFYGFRGSGQERDSNDKFTRDTATMGLGPEVYGLAKKTGALLATDGKTMAVWASGYPAIRVDDKFLANVWDGLDDAVMEWHVIRAVLDQRCASTKVIFAGYSQGSMAAKRVLDLREDSRVAAAVLMADPQFDPNSGGTMWGGFDKTRGGLLGRWAPPDWIKDHVVHVCAARDIVCQSEDLGAIAENALAEYFSGGIHTTFYKTVEATAITAALLRRTLGTSGTGGSTPGGGSGVATALIIDSSGSMSSNDPDDRRKDAARAYVSSALAADEVGVIDFDGSSRVASPAVTVGEHRAELDVAIASIDSYGGTNLSAGLNAGYSVLDGAKNPNRAAIFLTDGDGSYANEASQYAAKGWKIYTIGLGSVNTTLLRSIADQTGGRYIQLLTFMNLVCEFQQIRSEIAGLPTGTCAPSGHILQGATNTLQLTIPSGSLQGGRVQQATVTTVWGGSTIEMTLISPSGRRISGKTTDPDVVIATGDTFETFTITLPEPGEWTVELYGADIPEGGEEYYFSDMILPGGSADDIAPVVSWQDDFADGAAFDFGEVPAAPTCAATDDGSGVPDDGCIVTGYSQEVGTHTLTATAIDLAGNLSTLTLSYTVRPWSLVGFKPPVDTTVVGTAKGGSTVPLKFEIFNTSGEIVDVTAVQGITVQPLNCTSGDALGAVSTLSGLMYDEEQGQFVQLWRVPKKAGCFRATMTTEDGSSLGATFASN